MRSLLFIAGTALLMSACGKDDSAVSNGAVTQNLTAETITSNDTTSIDAATGADANMAEDVQMTVNDLDALNSVEDMNASLGNDF